VGTTRPWVSHVCHPRQVALPAGKHQPGGVPVAEERLITHQGPGDLIPRPDPTALTASAVSQAKEDLRRELAALREVIEARLDAMDNERRLLLQIVDERHAETGRRFAERDIRFSERDAARQDAVRTALDAAKNLSDARDESTAVAGNKFEASVREQIAQLGALASANRDQLSTQIDALKERIDRGEGSTTGAAGYRSERRLDVGQVMAGVAVLIALVSLILYVAKK
jgi:hypothetical protein